MKNTKTSLIVSLAIVASVFVVMFVLVGTGNLKPDEELLPASVGKLLNASTEHILVKFKPNISTLKRSQMSLTYGIKEKSEIKNTGVKLMSIPSGQTPQSVVDLLNNNEKDSIEFAEPDFVVELSFIPNDPWFTNWQKDKVQINAPLAWDSTTGTPNMILAIVDTGVNCNHEDLNGRCVTGWNFYDNNSNTSDVYGHGTAVAGVASAIGNNGLGVAGITWQSKIMPLRVSAIDGTASYSSIASAISYAADNGAKVVNASYQIGGSFTINTAADYLKNKGGLLVVSEGNYASDTGYKNSSSIISVSAVDPSDVLYSWSSFGDDVDVSAPGCTGATTKNDGGYGSFCGTSNSAPEVAGLLMLAWSMDPTLTPDQVQNMLFRSAKDLGTTLWDKYYGWGRVDAGAMISLVQGGGGGTLPNPLPAVAPLVTITAPLDGATLSSNTTISASATSDLKINKMEISINGNIVKTSTRNSITYKWNIRGAQVGTHTVTVRAYDSSDNIGQTSVNVYK